MYSAAFYSNRHRSTVYAARTVLSFVLADHPNLKSAVDVGCGVGSWLSILGESGITDILGLDGPWVDKALLEIPPEKFRAIDFNKGEVPQIDRRFDLAICLEVAEHILPQKGREFVEYLVSLSDNVLFSAAIPGQGGVGHVNEQWPQFWIAMFQSFNYELRDQIRSRIWNDHDIPVWYRQNVMFFSRACQTPAIRQGNLDLGGLPIVHPELFSKRMAPPHVRQAFGMLIAALRRTLRDRFLR
jgi:hypothetical protein